MWDGCSCTNDSWCAHGAEFEFFLRFFPTLHRTLLLPVPVQELVEKPLDGGEVDTEGLAAVVVRACSTRVDTFPISYPK